jgi:hypothetical protein
MNKGREQMTDNPAAEAHAAAAATYERAAEELDAAAAHLRHTARLFREGEVPRGCTHAFAAYGHIRTGQMLIDENAIVHASKAQP